MGKSEYQHRGLRFALSILEMQDQVPPQKPKTFFEAFLRSSRSEDHLPWITEKIVTEWIQRYLTPADIVVREELEEAVCKRIVYIWFSALMALGYDTVRLPSYF